MTLTERTDRLEQLKLELAAAEKARDYYNQVANEARDQSYEERAPQARDAFMSHAMKLRAQATRYANSVYEITKEIAALEGAATVVLTSEQCAAMDETHAAVAA